MNGLVLAQLAIGYDEPIIRDLDLTVPRGQIAAILGPSGCGKSTLLRTIAGLQAPLGGRILVDDIDVTHVPTHARGIGLVFQEPLLFTHLDVADNIGYGLRRSGTAKRAARTESAALLDWVGLRGFDHRSVQELSGGQAQRVALARAIAPQPGVLLLDEPFSALDVDLRRRLAREVAALLRDRDCATLYVTHDPDEAAVMADLLVDLAEHR